MHGGIRHLTLRADEGESYLVPAWMTQLDAAAAKVVETPCISIAQLRALRAFLDSIADSDDVARLKRDDAAQGFLDDAAHRNGMMPPGSRASLSDFFLSLTMVSGQAFIGCFARAQTLACQFDAMGVVDETVQDGVGVSRIADDFVPAVDGKLRRDDSRSVAIALFEDFQQIVLGGGVERLQPPIVQDQEIGSAKGAQKARTAPVAARQRELLE
jgi:hypothetical protein